MSISIKKPNLYVVSMLISFVMYIGWNLYEAELKKDKIASEGVLIIAKVIEVKYKLYRDNTSYKYAFDLSGKTYSSWTSLRYSFYEDYQYSVGDDILVIYDSNKPKVNYEYDYLLEKEYNLDYEKRENELDELLSK